MVKKYKSANGKMVDIDGIRLKNEEAIAVGNMRTNARGDELGPGGRIAKTRNERMNENYKLHTMVPRDDLVHDSMPKTEPEPSKMVTDIIDNIFPEEMQMKEKPTTPETPKQSPAQTSDTEPTQRKVSRGGLAAAIASSQSATTVNPEAAKPSKKVRRIG